MESRRFIPTSAKLALFAIAVSLMTAGCRSCTGNTPPSGNGNSSSPGTSGPGSVRSEPSREELIEAVRRSVNGKKYEEFVTRQEQVTHTCTQRDVDLDPHMPRNPELAKCPRPGATYTRWESVRKSETRECPSLPDPSAGWNVREIGENRWRVSRGGSAWDVENRGGRAVDQAVNISGFSLYITPHQKC